MHAPTKVQTQALTATPPGEPQVWLTAAGLGLGMLMVVSLLGVIVANGVPVFLPHRVVEATLKPGVESPIAGCKAIIGTVVQKRTKSVRVLDDKGHAQPDQTETQFYVGNKDAYGSSFCYLDSQSIQGMQEPRDILLVERMEYGQAFGVPLAVVDAEGKRVAYPSDNFNSRLQQLVSESTHRRAEIEKIEKRDIGRINSRLDKLRVEKANSAADQQEISQLEGRYTELAAQAKQLREQQQGAKLVLRLPNDTEKEIFVGDIVSYYFPNQVGFWSRVGLSLQKAWNFVSQDPREANTEGGIFPAIFGTFVMTLLMSVLVMPFGVVAAIYLREYAKQGFFVRAVRIAVNNLAGVPSIVFGVFGLGFFVYAVGGTIDQLFFSQYLPTPTFGTGGVLWSAFTLALMTVPVVIVATEEAIASVPRGMKEASLACGASKWQTIQRIVLPASLPGILTGLILAMARGAGEVAPLMLVGVVKLAPSLPIDAVAPFVHMERKFMHLGFHIYDLGFQSPDSEAAKPMVFATTLLLIALVIGLNLTAILLRERLRRRYAVGAF